MDSASEIAALRARIERLEKLAGLDPVPREQPMEPTPPPLPIVAAPIPPVASAPEPPRAMPLSESRREKNLFASEAWLARIGIGLLLIGLLFFLQLALRRGWITPNLQLLTGAAGCLAMIVWGEFLARTRPQIGNLAFGGGIAGLIGVIAAGQYYYEIYGGGTSCILTAIVTLACLAQALRRDSPALCILALLGAVLSPFFLGLQAPAVHALHSVAAAGLALAVFFFRGWRGVLATGAIGSWVLLLGASIGARTTGLTHDAAVAEGAAIFFWLAFWLTPVIRVLARPDSDERSQMTATWLGAVVPAMSGVLFTAIIWSAPSTHMLGAVSLGLAFVGSGLGLALRLRKPLTASAQFFAAAIFAGIAIPLLLDGTLLWIVFAVYAAALQGAIRWNRDQPVTIVAHLAALLCFLGVVILCVKMGMERRWEAGDVASLLVLLGSLVAAARLNGANAFNEIYCGLTHAGLIGVALAATAAGRLPEALLPIAGVGIALIAWFGLVGGRNTVSEASAHIILLLTTPYAGVKLLTAYGGMPWLNEAAISMLLLLATGLVIGLHSSSTAARSIYLWIAHVLWLVLLWSQFQHLLGGSMVSVAWAIYAVLLMVAGVIKSSPAIRAAGILSLLLMLVRLFTVDLAQLDLAVKTIIFIGIGAFLFAAGYFLPRFLPRQDDGTR